MSDVDTTEYVYGYQIKGNILNLYKRSSDYSGIEPEYSLTAPAEDTTSGLKIDYITAGNVFVDSTGVPESSPTENSYVDLNNMEIIALVDYIKFRLYQDAGNIQVAMYHENEYRTNLMKATLAMKPAGLRMSPQEPYAIR